VKPLVVVSVLEGRAEPGTAALGALAGVYYWLGLCLIVRAVVGRTRFTLATGVTVVRGALGAGLVSYPFIAASDGAAWLVPVVFAVAGLLDTVDGPIARQTGSVSKLGARLDTEADALVVLVGSVLVVAEGLAPTWFLLVGAARYVYVAGCWLYRTWGYELGEDNADRLPAAVYAGTMTAIWAALLPVTSPRLTNPLLAVVGLLLLGSFLRSWLVVTGVTDRDSIPADDQGT